MEVDWEQRRVILIIVVVLAAKRKITLAAVLALVFGLSCALAFLLGKFK